MTHWFETLAKIQGVFPEAIIAGGAIRDTILNRPVDDIDIFITPDSDWFKRKKLSGFSENADDIACQVEEDLVNVFTPMPVWANFINNGKYNKEWMIATYNAYSGYRAVNRNLKGKSYKYNIILMKNKRYAKNWAQELFNCFDFGICMIGTDGKKLFIDPRFVHDVKTKHLTLFNKSLFTINNKLDIYTQGHLTKLEKKYCPEYTSVL